MENPCCMVAGGGGKCMVPRYPLSSYDRNQGNQVNGDKNNPYNKMLVVFHNSCKTNKL